MNGAQMKGLRERLHRGRMDYLLGSHPIWEIVRGVYQMGNRPYVIGGMLILVAYFWNFLSGVEQTIPRDLMAFRRKDQMARLRYTSRRAAMESLTVSSLRGHKVDGN
jgi:hypothetical protein